MPKLTITAEEIGSSDAGAIVLHQTTFATRHDVLQKTKWAVAGVESTDRVINQNAIDRGNFLEAGVADWCRKLLSEMSDGQVDMWEPDAAFRKTNLKIASSVDRLIRIHNQVTLVDSLDSPQTFEGEGILEIKTDFYHQDEAKPEWIIQVMHQMICTDLDWAIIGCFTQKGHLRLYPVKRKEATVTSMLAAYEEFWNLVATDGEYPPIAEDAKPEPVDISDRLNDLEEDFRSLCNDYVKAQSEESQWRKTKEDVKQALVKCMKYLKVEYACLPGFEIKWTKKFRHKEKKIKLDEVVESFSFSVKELKDE